MAQPVCHITHLMYRFAAGGLENVVVQLINHLPRSSFRHTIIALTQADSDFIKRIDRDDVQVLQLGKPPGQPFHMYPAVYKLFRELRPDVLHTCNLAALEFAPVAFFAGIPFRIHAEHGWDIADPDGSNRRYRALRRAYRPFVHEFVAVSAQLYEYLRDIIGVPARRLHLIPNGVDTTTFRPARRDDVTPEGFPFRRPDHWIVGTVGRLEPIKNQVLLVDAFINLVQSDPISTDRMRLAIVGGGPLADSIRQRLANAGLAERLWLPGARADIPILLRCFDCFVLPSLSEGTSCTLQEAMATGLRMIATDVGGNAALLENGRLGHLVSPDDANEMAQAMRYAFVNQSTNGGENPEAVAAAQEKYSLEAAITSFEAILRSKEKRPMMQADSDPKR